MKESIRMGEDRDRPLGLNGESAFMVWPALGSKTAEEQNSNILLTPFIFSRIPSVGLGLLLICVSAAIKAPTNLLKRSQ